MNKKLQVFISSTYVDMLEERQAAVEAVLRAGHIPAGMELFAAGSDSQLETIRRWIDDSDVFMLILGGRYGSIEQTSGKSYIQLEYEYALEKKKPLFAAVISPQYLDSKIQASGKSAIETLNGVKLESFKDVVKSRVCRFFSDLNELKLTVFESLAGYAKNEELVGWVRGSDVIDPKSVLAEVERLQADNAALRSEVDSLNSFLAASSTLEHDIADELGEDAQNLLATAAHADGYILYSRYMGGASINAGGKEFLDNQMNPRDEMRWKAAIDSLQQQGLIEDVSFKGETFRVTKLGYEIADKSAADSQQPPI